MNRSIVSLCAVFAALAAGVILAPAPVAAQQAERIGSFYDWDAYTRGAGENKFCYMVSKPVEASLRSRRGDIFFLVWHRPSKKEFDVVQVDIGYLFKEKTEVEIQIGGDSWALFTRDESAWTYRTADDTALVEALRKGARMTVKGVSGRGNPTTDTYSLKGTSAAYQAINRACGR
jgi:invasion protein IalB